MMRNYRTLFALLAGTTLAVWIVYMNQHQLWSLFPDYWFMTATMAFGSFIAGTCSEGGGAIAYPVMTLFFDIETDVARNFSFAIQSVGMTFAAIWIFLSKIKIENNYLILAGFGGFAGIIFGSFSVVSPTFDFF